MTISNKRIAAVLLALSGLYVAAWALLAPRSFYDDFPGLGRHWVAMMPSYNEHLVRDVGALYLALGLLAVLVAVRPLPESFLLVGAGWTAFNVLHLGFHLGHLDGMPTLDAWMNPIVLVVVMLLSVLLMLPTRPADRPADRSAERA